MVLVENVEQPINAISCGRDSDLVVVAGRSVLKIYSFDDTGFCERQNLRTGGRNNLNYSALDVAWHPTKSNLIASASTNRAVVVWDLDKIQRNKMKNVYTEHRRTVNKVCFHPRFENTILSASLDGTIGCYDTDSERMVCVFTGGGESIRDIQFDPHNSNQFAAADENGNVKIWDFRNASVVNQITAHGGPVSAVDYHPDHSGLLATAGRDKQIKVWNLLPTDTVKQGVPTACIQTIAPVSKVKWRRITSLHSLQIASCSQVMDNSVSLWDTRRPYIPFHCLDEHADVPTGLLWHPTDGNRIISCGRDGYLMMHKLSDAKKMEQCVNPMALDIDPTGCVAFAISNAVLQDKRPDASPLIASFSRSHRPKMFQTQEVRSSMFITEPRKLDHDVSNHDMNMNWFIDTALGYKLNGKKASELATHNAAVAETLNRHQVAETWRILKSILCSNELKQQSSLTKPMEIAGDYSKDHDGTTLTDHARSRIGSRQPSGHHPFHRHHHHHHHQHHHHMGTETETNSESEFNAAAASRGLRTNAPLHSAIPSQQPLSAGDPRGRLFSSSIHPANSAATNGTNTGASGGGRHPHTVGQGGSTGGGNAPWSSDYFFGDGDMGKMVFDEFETFGNTGDPQGLGNDDWSLPNEAFQPRVDIDTSSGRGGGGAGNPTPMEVIAGRGGSKNEFLAMSGRLPADAATGDPGGSEDNEGDGRFLMQNGLKKVVVMNPQLIDISNGGHNRVGTFETTPSVKDVLRIHSDEGDVQTCVSVLLVFRDKVKGVVPPHEQQLWYEAYLDLLNKFRLFTVAALVIKQCPLQSINYLSQQSTRLHIACNRCGKEITGNAWHCQHCNKFCGACAVCQEQVFGLYIWCHGCSHGGHLEHMQSWFATETTCPTGCGHACTMSPTSGVPHQMKHSPGPVVQFTRSAESQTSNQSGDAAETAVS